MILPLEMRIFTREYFSGANTVSAYYTSRLVSRLPLELGLPAFFSFVVYSIAFGWNRQNRNSSYDSEDTTIATSINDESANEGDFENTDWVRKMWFIGIMTLYSNVFIGFGHLLSAIFRNSLVVLISFPLFCIPSITFGSPMIPLGAVPEYLRIASYFSILRYTMQCLWINEFENTNKASFPSDSSGVYKSATTWFKHMDIDTSDVQRFFYVNVAILFGLVILTRLLAIIILRQQTISLPFKSNH